MFEHEPKVRSDTITLEHPKNNDIKENKKTNENQGTSTLKVNNDYYTQDIAFNDQRRSVDHTKAYPNNPSLSNFYNINSNII